MNGDRALSAPVKVSIDVTNRCNLRCSHCRLGDGSSSELSLAELKDLIDELADAGVFVLGLSGGEPFARADFIDVLFHAASTRIPKIYVSTNATCIDASMASQLARLPAKVVFRVSLDGLADVHDAIRRTSGCSERSVAGINRIRGAGRGVEVTTTLMRTNLGDAPALVEFTRSLGVRKHRFISLMPVGRATEDLVLSRDQERHVSERIGLSAASSPEPPSVTVDIPFLATGDRQFTCRAGTWECAVLADGSIVGCKLMPDLVEGDVRHASLCGRWRDPEAFSVFRGGIDFQQDPECRRCAKAPVCRGGCPAYIRALSGQLHGRDPRCGGAVLTK